MIAAPALFRNGHGDGVDVGAVGAELTLSSSKMNPPNATPESRPQIGPTHPSPAREPAIITAMPRPATSSATTV
jgi:hypothetical protein